MRQKIIYWPVAPVPLFPLVPVPLAAGVPEGGVPDAGVSVVPAGGVVAPGLVDGVTPDPVLVSLELVPGAPIAVFVSNVLLEAFVSRCMLR